MAIIELLAEIFVEVLFEGLLLKIYKFFKNSFRYVKGKLKKKTRLAENRRINNLEKS